MDQTINDLKVLVYDKLVQVERHQLSIQQLQKEIAELNRQIQEQSNNKV